MFSLQRPLPQGDAECVGPGRAESLRPPEHPAEKCHDDDWRPVISQPQCQWPHRPRGTAAAAEEPGSHPDQRMTNKVLTEGQGQGQEGQGTLLRGAGRTRGVSEWRLEGLTAWAKNSI